MATVSVKVMRSYDYCLFECSMSTNIDRIHCYSFGQESELVADVSDKLRKKAASVVDHAVEQYKKLKVFEKKRIDDQIERSRLADEIDFIREHVPENERTEGQKAKLKAYDDYQFQSQFDYD